MISVERALNSIRGKSVEEIREFVHNRILGHDTTLIGSGHSTEPSEDLVIQLLKNFKLEGEKRVAVLCGCVDVYRMVREWVDDFNWVSDVSTWKDVVVRLCRVVDMAEPLELKKHAKSLLVLLLEEASCPSEVLGAVVRAYMGYGISEDSIRFWEDEILTNKDVAAYGFNALLDIDPMYDRIEEHLFKLWRLQLEENWPLNTAFLLRRSARLRNETALIYRVLLKLKNSDLSLWEKIESELNQPWSQPWLKKLAELETLRPQAVSKKKLEKDIERERKEYPDLEIEFRDIGVDPDKLYYFNVEGRMHPSSIHYIDYINKFLERLESRKRMKLVNFGKEPKEIAHVSKDG